jgi:hypothetical protein
MTKYKIIHDKCGGMIPLPEWNGLAYTPALCPTCKGVLAFHYTAFIPRNPDKRDYTMTVHIA